jgi:SAM-dependent methyltransferase
MTEDRDGAAGNDFVAWPPMPGHAARPHWTGRAFAVAGQELSILQYGIRPSGWDDERADLVEHEIDDKKPIGKASRQQALRELRRFLDPATDPVILEVGCSSGFLLKDLLTVFPNARVVGAEYALPALVRLSSTLPTVPLVQMDLTCAPLPDESFDAVLALNVLEHIEDDLSAMVHMRRMLKPGGIAIIEVPASPGLFDLFDSWVGHHRRYRMRDLTARLENAGFEVMSRSHLGFFVFPVFWLGKKKSRHFGAGTADKRALTVRALQIGKRSRILELAFRLEGLLRPFVYLPFGIRCLVTVRKPAPTSHHARKAEGFVATAMKVSAQNALALRAKRLRCQK